MSETARGIGLLITMLASFGLMIWGGWTLASGDWRDGMMILTLAYVLDLKITVERGREPKP